jgi:hypothetical protein
VPQNVEAVLARHLPRLLAPRLLAARRLHPLDLGGWDQSGIPQGRLPLSVVEGVSRDGAAIDARRELHGCTCRPFTTDAPRFLDQPGDTVDVHASWQRGADCPHYAPVPERDEEAGSGWTQLEARAFNAVGPAVRDSGQWLPLSARRAVAKAVLAELKPELAALARVQTLIAEHPVAVGTHLLEEALDQAATQVVVTVHGARDLSPTAQEALGALINIAKRQITEERP